MNIVILMTFGKIKMPHELRKGERCNSENTASNRKEAISTTIHKLTFELTWSKFKRSLIILNMQSITDVHSGETMSAEKN